MKPCSACSIPKPLSEYHKNKANKDGHQHYCKDCRKDLQKAYRAGTADYIRLRYKLDEDYREKRKYYSRQWKLKQAA